ncbi:MAG: hypothetical protein LUI10_00305 [Lachnospiraceae bacterium]|nr:hypothetical protein [Lachnospiraceae bacterium]
MNNDTTEMIENLRRELRLTRIITIVSILLTLCMAGLVIYFQHTVQTAVEPLTEQMAEMDMDTLNSIMEDMEVMTGELAEADIDWEKLSDTVNSLDVEAFNEAIAGLNTEEFSEAIENLNDAIEALQNLGSSASSLTDWLFGGN